jgi:hypothetical protein
MTEQPASRGPTTTMPPQSANGTSPQFPAAPAHRGSERTRLSAGFVAFIAKLRQIMRRDRRRPQAS